MKEIRYIFFGVRYLFMKESDIFKNHVFYEAVKIFSFVLYTRCVKNQIDTSGI